MPQKPKQQREKAKKQRERLDAQIRRRFKVSLMSNAEWKKLLALAAEVAEFVPKLNYKLVHSEQVHQSFTESIPEAIEDIWFREPVLYKELEWVEFPHRYLVERGPGLVPIEREQDLSLLKEKLKGHGEFPLVETNSGLRVVGYKEA